MAAVGARAEPGLTAGQSTPGGHVTQPWAPPPSASKLDTFFYFKNYLKIPWFGEVSPARFSKSTFTCQAESGVCLDAAGFNKKISG